MSDLRLKAKAIVAVRKRKREAERAREALVSDILSRVNIPTPEAGKAGRDAPELSDILKAITPLLPETKIEQTVVEKTIVQQINTGELEEAMSSFIEGRLPEMDRDNRPRVELIREDVSEEKLKGFVTKEDLDDALRRVQDAIMASQSSGGGSGTVENNHDLPWHVTSTEILDDKEQAAIHGELVVEADIVLEGSAQLVVVDPTSGSVG